MLAFVHARLIDGTGRPPLEDATVLIDGKYIVFVGSGSAVPEGDNGT